ncbi:MAG TPA: WhiB family transcriptional regulator [Candidatus Saccharimonadales bacterium]|nr:WhiB family transcriptional regulator [Candidatus Saccharimonadales bacterium]
MGYGESLSAAKRREQEIIYNQQPEILRRLAGVIPEIEGVMDELNDTALDWQKQARCQAGDPEVFFVKGAAQNDAKPICKKCPVRVECRQYALENRIEFGVWGGMTERERRAYLKSNPNTIAS